MDTLEAVSIAKQNVLKLFADEKPFNIGLEEVTQDEDGFTIVIGFSREWDRIGGAMGDLLSPTRTSKAIKLDRGGHLLAVRNQDRSMP